MVEKEVIVLFFRDILERHLYEFQVDQNDFRVASLWMRFTYKPKRKIPSGAPAAENCAVDYDNPSYRCAYLHRYAAIHSSLVQDILLKNQDVFQNLCAKSGSVKICCLGGGPGSDIVGISSALCAVDPSSGKTYFFTTVDLMEGWFYTHNTLNKVADEEKCGTLSHFLRSRIAGSFICDDLLSPSVETIRSVRNADLLSMVKLISIIPPELVLQMLKNIFRWMKPHAVLLFVDNSGGGFYEAVSLAARSIGLVEIGQCFREMEYGDEIFHREIFGLESRSSLSVTVKLLQKR